MDYQLRTYRNWVQTQDLLSFTVSFKQSDLFIRADKLLHQQAEEHLRRQRKLIQDYIQKDSKFATALKPYSIKEEAPPIIQEMAKAASLAGVGPMAAVAGAIAEDVGRELLKYSSQIIVENGGDIFMKTNKTTRVGLFAGKSCYTGRLVLEVAPTETSWGICTSSGTVGPSLSFGQADAAVVVCKSAILADAWATRLGNMVKSSEDVEKVIQFSKDEPTITGVAIIIDEKIGVWGDIKLVAS